MNSSGDLPTKKAATYGPSLPPGTGDPLHGGLRKLEKHVTGETKNDYQCDNPIEHLVLFKFQRCFLTEEQTAQRVISRKSI